MLRLRFKLVQLFFCLGFFAVWARLAYLQLWCHDDLTRRAEHQFERIIKDAPRRGPILDRDGRILTESVRVASCYADPTMIRQPDKYARLLAPILDLPASAISQKIKNEDGSFVWLKRFLPVDRAEAVRKLNMLGIGLSWEYRRDYPNGNLAGHLLGMIGTDGQGLSGVERVANECLIDTRPPRRALRDGRGTGVSDRFVDTGDEDRTWVKLSIDRTIQFIAERELEWGMKRSRAKSGIIVVQDSHTGEVLAMASRPNLNLGADRPKAAEELSIPAVQWVFEPGSTFKVVTAAAAIEEGLVRPSETFNCENGHWKYADMKIHDHEPEGILTFAQVIERSSNIGTAKVGLRLGKIKLYDYIRAFGFGARTGSEIPGESAGLLRPPSRWSGVSVPVISFGQEVGVTALQLACAYSAIANGGLLFEPRIFLGMRDQKGEERRWEASSLVRRVISPETAASLRKILQGVVDRGTGEPARLEGWSVAGKTGTAQKMDPRTKLYSENKFIASFCGFAPAKNPKLTIVVIYNEPQGVSYGGYNAGPVFKNVAWHALTYMGVPPDQEAPVAARPAKKKNKSL